jgi:hypothetical protein
VTGEEQTLAPILLRKVSRAELTRCEALAQRGDAFVSGALQRVSGRDIEHQRPPKRLRGCF